MDEGPHGGDRELRDLTLRLLRTVAQLDASEDGDDEWAAEMFDRELVDALDEYQAAVDRRRHELRDRPDALEALEWDHALVMIDANEAAGHETYRQLEPVARRGIAMLQHLAATDPDPEQRAAFRRELLERGLPVMPDDEEGSTDDRD